MTTPRPVTSADYDRVKELHAQGLSRNAIGKQMGRSGRTVSRIAAELGLTFERGEQIRAATEARKADAAERRSRLQVEALEGAQKLMGQMFAPTTIYNFGGRDNEYNERSVKEPPFRDKRDIATALKALADTALKLAEYDKATGHDGDRSMLVDLRDALRTARDNTRSQP